jgi:hypothetical protein
MRQATVIQTSAIAGIVVVLMATTPGCATEYVPRTSHRVAIVQSGGSAKFTRDAQTFGLWDLDQAVAGNPEAEAHARTFVHRTVAGLVVEVAGIGLIAGGASLATNAPSSSTTRRDVASGLALGGVVALVGSFVAILSGVPHIYDAINIYNDGLPPEANR